MPRAYRRLATRHAALQEYPERQQSQSSRPTPLQVKYRLARLDALAEGRPVTDVALAREVGCRNATISEWKRNPGFHPWLTEEERLVAEMMWPAVIMRATQVAMEGSVPHLKFVLMLRD